MRRAGKGAVVGNLKRPLGGTRGKLEDNIKEELAEMECEGVEWSHVAQDMDKWELL